MGGKLSFVAPPLVGRGCKELTFARPFPRDEPLGAALDRDWIKTKEVIPWTAVASTTGPTSGNSSRVRWFAIITPSIRNFVEPGSAKPAARLMTISTRLVASNPRRGRARTRNSGRAAQRLVLAW